MLNPFNTSAMDTAHVLRLRQILVDDLYRRALFPMLVLIPVLYVFYLAVADVIDQRPSIFWAFAFLLVVLIARLAAVLLSQHIKARFPSPSVRVGIFALAAALMGCAMGAVNFLAAPVISAEQLELLMIISVGINATAILSMSPSLLSYLLYMVPNTASILIALLIGPTVRYSGILELLTVLNLVTLVLMSSVLHIEQRRSILFRLEVDEINAALHDANRQLNSEIRERLAAEDALKQRNAELERLNLQLASTQTQLIQSEKMASIGQLAAGIAHEINNPVAFVRCNLNNLKNYMSNIASLLGAFATLERESIGASAARRRLAQVKVEVDAGYLLEDIPALLDESADGLTRVEKIVRDLQQFSQVDRAEWQRVDLHQCLESTLGMAAHEIRGKADVVREYGDLPAVECMPFQINQVFLNLLINATQAIDASTRGTITLRSGRDGDWIWVQVADNGNGIERANLQRIFDPFFTTKPIGAGRGLGLSVSYGIVRKHGGRIEVSSQPGKGTSFTVHLPINPTHAVQSTAGDTDPVPKPCASS